MHPLWQIKQIITIDGSTSIVVDIVHPHGSRLFMGLVIWIVIYERGITDVLHYMDDAWSYDLDERLYRYESHDTSYPFKQGSVITIMGRHWSPPRKAKQLMPHLLRLSDSISIHPHCQFTSPKSHDSISLQLFLPSYVTIPDVDSHSLTGSAYWVIGSTGHSTPSRFKTRLTIVKISNKTKLLKMVKLWP